ncbi:MAG: 5-formyltetrahydrofolate cyclo-ligase [Bacillota bacterium]|nr:5-formyltetrahydrofolate cyclo-ligase [Bacillota bacterium]
MASLTKSEWRRRILARRESLTPAEVERLSAAVTRLALRLPELQEPSGVVLGYFSFRNEVKAEEILKKIQARGGRIALPVADRVRKTLVASEVYALDRELITSPLGIKEPAPGHLRPLNPEELAAILVPGVAFDLRGYRLGYGAGYYDRFLSAFFPRRRQGGETPRPVLIGLAFEFQLVPSLPPEPHDLPLDVLVTEKRVLRPLAAAEA